MCVVKCKRVKNASKRAAKFNIQNLVNSGQMIVKDALEKKCANITMDVIKRERGLNTMNLEHLRKKLPIKRKNNKQMINSEKGRTGRN